MWTYVAIAIVAAIPLVGAGVWIAGLLWAAREDGRDQAAYDAEYGAPVADDRPKAPPDDASRG